MNYKWASNSKFHQSNSLSCEQISPRILCVELNDDDDDGNDADKDDTGDDDYEDDMESILIINRRAHAWTSPVGI